MSALGREREREKIRSLWEEQTSIFQSNSMNFFEIELLFASRQRYLQNIRIGNYGFLVAVCLIEIHPWFEIYHWLNLPLKFTKN